MNKDKNIYFVTVTNKRKETFALLVFIGKNLAPRHNESSSCIVDVLPLIAITVAGTETLGANAHDVGVLGRTD